jgi:hypothetical protein
MVHAARTPVWVHPSLKSDDEDNTVKVKTRAVFRSLALVLLALSGPITSSTALDELMMLTQDTVDVSIATEHPALETQ